MSYSAKLWRVFRFFVGNIGKIESDLLLLLLFILPRRRASRVVLNTVVTNFLGGGEGHKEGF